MKHAPSMHDELLFSIHDLPAPIIIYDKKTLCIRDWNSLASDLFNYKSEARPLLKTIRPFEAHIDQHTLSNKQNTSSESIIAHQTSDGIEKFLAVTRKEISMQGEVCYLEWLTDQTLYIQTQGVNVNFNSALSSLNANLSETLIFGKMGSATLNLTTRQLQISKELLMLLDEPLASATVLPLEEFLSRYVSPLFVDVIHAKIKEGLQGLNNLKKEVDVSFEMITATGRKIWIACKGIFKDNTALGILHDVTESKRAESEVKKLALIAHHANNAVILTDVDGKVTWVNDSFERITEYARYEVIGLQPGKLLQGIDTSADTIAHMRKAIKDGEGFKVEILNYSKSGRKYWVDIEVMPVQNDDGTLAGFMAIESDITNMKVAIQEMQRSEQALQTFMDHAPMMAFVKDLQGRYTFNNKMHDDMHASKALRSGYTDYDLFDQQHADANALHDKLIVDTGDTLHFEKHIQDRTFLEYKFPLRDVYHAIFAVGGISLDISEKLQAQQRIAESEERFRTLVSDISIGMLLQGPRSEIHLCNQAALDLLGLTEDQLLGRTWFNPGWNMIHEDGTEFSSHNHPVPRAIASKLPVRGIVIGFYRSLKEDRVWLLVDAIPRLNDDGHVKNVICTFNDITRLKETEGNLKFTRFTIDHTADSILWIRPNGTFADMNPAAHNALGYTFDELINLKIFDVHYAYTTEAWDALWKELRVRKTLTVTSRHRKKNGTEVDVEISANFIMFKGQEFNCAFVRDIAERKKSEQALRASNDEKDALIKEIHHRVKNNLQLISSMLYIKMAGMQKSEMKDFLEDTRQKIRTIALIHERFLQTGSVNVVDLSDYLGKLINDLQMSNTRQDLNIVIHSNIAPEMMGLDAAIYYGLIITELVTNAIKHAFTNRVHGTIHIDVKQIEQDHYMIVSDDGCSLPPHIAPGQNGSFGMQLLDIFTKQLNGDVSIDRTKGTIYTFTFRP